MSSTFSFTTFFSHTHITHNPHTYQNITPKQFPFTFLISILTNLIILQAQNFFIICDSSLSSLISSIFNLSYLPWEDFTIYCCFPLTLPLCLFANSPLFNSPLVNSLFSYPFDSAIHPFSPRAKTKSYFLAMTLVCVYVNLYLLYI